MRNMRNKRDRRHGRLTGLIGRGLFITLALFLDAPAPAPDCEPGYQKIKAEYTRLQEGPGLTLADCRRLQSAFRDFADHNPRCGRADDALYMAGMLGGRAFRSGGNRDDLKNSLAAFDLLSREYPESSLADVALYHSGEIYLILGDRESARDAFGAASLVPGGDMAASARKQLDLLATPASAPATTSVFPAPGATAKPASTPSTAASSRPAPVSIGEALSGSSDGIPAGMVCPPPRPEPATLPAGPMAKFLGIRYWSNKDYTRVVIDLDRQVPYDPPHLLKPDPTLGTPPRLFIDFQGTEIPPNLAAATPEAGCYTLPIGDGLLKKARAGRFQPGVARVVIDIERIDHFVAFPMPGETFRYVIDIYGTPARTRRPTAPAPLPGDTATHGTPRPAPLAGGRKILIVIDAGHGGKDPGAVGPTGLQEKTVTLEIARRVQRVLEGRRSDVRVVLTRTDDRYLSLVERTAMANTLGADLFVSVHINAAPNRDAHGIETYHLDNTTDHASLRLAAKENFVSEEVMTSSRDTTNLILADMITSSKVEDSVPLARLVQQSLVSTLNAKYEDVPNLGVKKAPFWVLTGAIMPCVLTEVNFISNRDEEKRLRTSAYQQAAAEAIAAGIISYLDRYPLVMNGD